MVVSIIVLGVQIDWLSEFPTTKAHHWPWFSSVTLKIPKEKKGYNITALKDQLKHGDCY